jgi:hypothetical chaperone protein
MPMLGLGSLLRTGRLMPSTPYFNLATWHTINQAYSRKSISEINDLHREASDKPKLERLQSLVRERAGHWLAMQVEEAKIALSGAPQTDIDISRIAAGQRVTLQRTEFDGAIDPLVTSVEQTVSRLLKDAGVPVSAVDTVFFTGGSSGVPLLRQRVQALVPLARCVEGDLFGSIGAGLALDAQRKFG